MEAISTILIGDIHSTHHSIVDITIHITTRITLLTHISTTIHFTMISTIHTIMDSIIAHIGIMTTMASQDITDMDIMDMVMDIGACLTVIILIITTHINHIRLEEEVTA